MIRIERPATGSSILKRKGERQTKSDCESYDACPSDYNSGVKKFPRRNYYSSKPVKKLLVDIHHGKCCFCETWFAESINLDVEHFRPKAGVRQDLDQKEDELPGYYWLAYRWDNLLLSCNACNRQFKKTLFPLKNPSDRARNHNEDVQGAARAGDHGGPARLDALRRVAMLRRPRAAGALSVSQGPRRFWASSQAAARVPLPSWLRL